MKTGILTKYLSNKVSILLLVVLQLYACNDKEDLQNDSIAVSDEELAERKKSWKQKDISDLQGTLKKYNKLVSTASEGCVTDKF